MTSEHRPPFPFSAVVGQDDLSLALLLCTVDPAIGGVLLRGQKGSGKTTLARGLAALLPDGGPFVELPIGASEDRLVGSIDLRAALAGGDRRFSPGLLHAVDGGVLYVDEVNLLPDHLVDVLLDVASSGINRVEREGISHLHPSRFVLVGSMNPEEGELRPQLLDRFGLSVEVAASTDPEERAEAVGRRLAFDRDPVAFATNWLEPEGRLRSRLESARPAKVPHRLVRQITHLCAASGAEGLRADLVVCRAAGALAGWEGRSEATEDDVRRVAPLALAHRRRRSPFEAPGMDADELASMLDDAFDDSPGGDAGGSADDGNAGGGSGGGSAGQGDDGSAGSSDVGSVGVPRGTDGEVRREADENGGDASSHVDSDDPGGRVPLLAVQPPARFRRADPVAPAASGRRSVEIGPRGRTVGERVPAPGGLVAPVAVTATIAAAAARHGVDGVGPVVVGEADLRESVRLTPTANLVILAVDASGSMHAEGRMAAAKGAVLALLVDAYQRRDRVALVTFGGAGASVVLRPTGSTEVAQARLAELATGGRTPLAAGVLAALEVATGTSGGAWRPLVVVVTDGRATSAPEGIEPVAAAMEAASRVRRRGISAVVVDAEDAEASDSPRGRTSGIRLGLARELAQAMGARYLTVAELTAEAIVSAVRASLPSI